MDLHIGRFNQGWSLWSGAMSVIAVTVLGLLPICQRSFACTFPQAIPTDTTTEAEGWRSYEPSFEMRWREILQHPEKRDRTKWRALENDLRGGAKKYNQRIEEETSKPMTGATAVVNSTFTVPCLSQYDKPGARCFVFPERKGDCRYLCVPIPKNGSLSRDGSHSFKKYAMESSLAVTTD